MKQFYFFLIIVFFSCSEKEVKDNSNLIINRNKFIDVLEEIYLAEAKFELNKINNREKSEIELSLDYQKIYEEFSINKESFKYTLEYYSENPELLESLYFEVLEILKENQLKLR